MRISQVWPRAVGTIALLCVTASSGWAQTGSWYASLSGAAESPPVASLGTGYVSLTRDVNSLRIFGNFSGLTGLTTAAHIHCCTAVPLTGNVGVATMTPSFTGFPLSVTGGAFDMTFDMASIPSWNPAFITANGGTPAFAFTALVAGFNNGTSYFNIHTSTSGGGEIRGFIQVVPEPSTYALMAAGLIALGFVSRRRQRVIRES